MNPPFLGCIADDFTGATDLANNLVRAGMRVVQTIGVPDAPFAGEADAIVVALKSRTIPAAEAVAQSLAALKWLQAQGTRQTYFKYCSTFDSTAEGNIGPVTDALMDALGTDFTIACPAFPENGRTVFKGYLFVGDELLHESGMRNHPLTPMTDSNLVRVLQAQTARCVGLIDHRTVAEGTGAIEVRIAALRAEGVAMAIVDATSNADLVQMGRAFATLPLLTAGSGVAIGLPQNFGLDTTRANAAQLPAARGLRAIVSGSCSTATNAQVADFKARGGAAFAIDPLRLAENADLAGEALAWAEAHMASGPVLVYATAEPEAVRAVQAQLGVARAGEMVEHALAHVAR
ncbi:MAG: four-carbon acid sugar kinase family protein, partial [Variovorax sp.]